MSKILILGLVIITLLLIITWLTIDKMIRTWTHRRSHTFDPETDCQFFVGQDRYELRAGTEVQIGPDTVVAFSKNTQATIRVHGDVAGDIITDRGDVTITGNVTGGIKTGAGDVIIGGSCTGITTGSGDAVINGDCNGPVKSNSGNISIEKVIEITENPSGS